MASLTSVKSIKFPNGRKLVRIAGETSPPEVHFPGGVVLKLAVRGGRVVGGTATDHKGQNLQVIMLKMSTIPNKPHLRGALAAVADRCSVCVCTADGGCKCIDVECPK